MDERYAFNTRIEVFSYNYEELLQGIMEHCKTDNRMLVEKILLAGGEKIGDTYLILNNEYWEEINSYNNVPAVLDELFGAEDVFSACFCTDDDKYGLKEVVPSMSIEDIKKKCGIDI